LRRILADFENFAVLGEIVCNVYSDALKDDIVLVERLNYDAPGRE
jgi:hypothetical protein